MFQEAYKSAQRWLFPIAVSTKLRNGRVGTSLGAGFIINSDGWFLTAGHVLHPYIQQRAVIAQDRERPNKAAEIRALGLDRAEEQKRLRALGHPDPDGPEKSSIWLGLDGLALEEVHIDPFADLAVAKIRNFNPGESQTYPTLGKFADPDYPPGGKSLCILGFSFAEFRTRWDEASDGFVVLPGCIPVPRFPKEGILTRGVHAIAQDRDTGEEHRRRFIELSCPGYKGQSGGPVFDTNGVVCGVQSQTSPIELGFGLDENQYALLAWAVFPNFICDFLDERGIEYDSVTT